MRVSSLWLGAVLVIGCGEPTPQAPTTTLVPEPIALGIDVRTTDGETACGNLDAQITALTRLSEASGDPSQSAGLVPLLLLRSQLRGDIADADTALETARRVSDPALRSRLVASALSALHEWDEALATLADDPSTQSTRDAIALARGEDLDAILARRVERAAREPSWSSESDLALALSEAGRFDEADAAYLRALRFHRDVSPFPVALLQFQRGVMWSERAGRPGRAIPLYREAVRLVPSFVAANVHLAELELEMRASDAAIARLRRVAEASADPEPRAVLAAALLTKSPIESQRFLAEAREGYDRLLETHRLAYADHAAELFLGVGDDPPRARELALANLENRHGERAYDLALRAVIATGDLARACSLATEAPRPAHTVDLDAKLAELDLRCR